PRQAAADFSGDGDCRLGDSVHPHRRADALYERHSAAVFASGRCVWWIYRGAGMADAAGAGAKSFAGRIKMPRMRGRSSGAQGGRGLWNRPPVIVGLERWRTCSVIVSMAHTNQPAYFN